MLQKVDAGPGHLPQVVGRDVGGHAHGNARGAVQEQVGEARRQHHGLLEGAVEIQRPVHGALPQLAQEQLGVPGEARLGVAHGGKGLGVVRGAPVALTLHQGVAVGEGLGHEHHGLVAGRVPVGVVLAQHVAHSARRLLELGAGLQAQLRHGIDDTPLHRLEPVADVGQGPVEHHVHGVLPVGVLGEGLQGHALHPVLAHFDHGVDGHNAPRRVEAGFGRFQAPPAMSRGPRRLTGAPVRPG